MQKRFLEREKREKKPVDIEGKTDYGKRKKFTFWLTKEQFEKAKAFFDYKENHDEPDSEKLMRLIG